MTTDEIIQELVSRGAKFEVSDDKLKVMLSKEKMTADMANLIKENKQEIIRYINARQNNRIHPATTKEYYATSPAQKRQYFLHELYQSSLAYNLPHTNKIEGEITVERLQDVFEKLIARHESLRTSFRLMNGDPVQVISQEVDFRIEHCKATEAEADDIIRKFVRPFDLAVAPLMRVGLIALSDCEYILIVDMHHIVTDGVSHVLLLNDFIQLYHGNQLPDVVLQYKDYAEWLHNSEQEHIKAKQRKFWLDRFADNNNGFDLPVDFSRPAIKDYQGDRIHFSLSPGQTAALRAFTRAESATLFMTLLAVYNVLLSKLSGQEDVVVGTPVTGRSHSDMENILGMFVNILPLRNRPEGGLSFRQFLAELKANTLACIDHQDFQYEELIDALKIDRNPGSYPLIDIMYVHHGFKNPEMEFPGLTLTYYPYSSKVSKFDLMLTSVESEHQVNFEVEFSTALFKPETIVRFTDFYKQVLIAVTEAPDKKLADIVLRNTNEKNGGINNFNSLPLNYQARETVVDLFERQVLEHPHQIATVCNGNTTTFVALQHQMDKIAVWLQQEYQLGKGDLAGILLERGDLMIPAILAVLKAGAVYVPLDPHHPADRINAIIQDAGLKVLITSGDDADLPAGTRLVNIEKTTGTADQLHQGPVAVDIAGTDPAYVIYTSGSTGKPKGVSIQHAALNNYISWAAGAYLQHEKGSFPLFTSVAFDLTITSIFVPLITGGTIHIYPESDHHFPVDQVLSDNQSCIVKLTPSHLKLLKESSFFHNMDYKSKIKRLIVGGEELTTQLAKEIHQLFNGEIEIYNEYGPTEATVGCMIHRFNIDRDTGRTVPIGKPAANTRIYLLDKYLHPVPAGVVGEIFIAGAGLAEGYLHNISLTKERFPENPHIRGERMYKTGDLGKWLPGGDIEFVGRRDSQVKINGYRIETGEIESYLTGHDDIKESVVIARNKEGEKYLVAYYVALNTIDEKLLREYLQQRLPDYMVPAYIIRLESLPLTPNGKTDINALPAPQTGESEQGAAASNETEERLVLIWSEILRIDSSKIDVNANFFVLGGHSLRTYNLLHRIEKEFDVRIPLLTFFEKPTIKELHTNILVARLSQKANNNYNKVSI
ncbi:amino acid adenylation domain-containing protein [Chitinophaga sp. RAB17]|uniref:non-ribosomal peptide synthetase n=1 Tax=Chitinophaga sp. RAB17 TaxID=3233049 RepID=UPI003F916DA1